MGAWERSLRRLKDSTPVLGHFQILLQKWCILSRSERANKKINARVQIAQPKFLIGKMQAQIAKIIKKIEKAQIVQEKIKLVKRKPKFFKKFSKAHAQRFKKNKKHG